MNSFDNAVMSNYSHHMTNEHHPNCEGSCSECADAGLTDEEMLYKWQRRLAVRAERARAVTALLESTVTVAIATVVA